MPVSCGGAFEGSVGLVKGNKAFIAGCPASPVRTNRARLRLARLLMRTNENKLVVGSGLLMLAVASVVVWFGMGSSLEGSRRAAPTERSSPSTDSLRVLLAAPEKALMQMDVDRMNLLCAEGLPGADDMGVEKCLVALDAMAASVRTETDRHFYRFKKTPVEFESSEGFFRMVIMGVVLAEDFRVKYSPAKAGTAAEPRTGDGFFADPDDVFLSGLLGPKRQGTCSSLPVLYVAVGRKLGYPLKLVTTKGHLFVRWQDAKERFNIEVTSRGVNKFPDDYYRHWPMEVSEVEVAAEGYLKSLDPAEELAVFLSIRGMCWRALRPGAGAIGQC
jgi:hypothetical protein